jgi:hypothetical protein
MTFARVGIKRKVVMNERSRTVIMSGLDRVDEMNWEKLPGGEFFRWLFMNQPYRTTRNLSSLHVPTTESLVEISILRQGFFNII